MSFHENTGNSVLTLSLTSHLGVSSLGACRPHDGLYFSDSLLFLTAYFSFPLELEAVVKYMVNLWQLF